MENQVDPPEWAVRTKADQEALTAGYYWDQSAADKAIAFLLKFFQPRFSRKQFHLLKWQERFIRSLYGWKSPEGGKRWKRVILHISKKQGKTLMICCVLFLELFLSDMPDPVVASASTSSENAIKQVYSQLAYTIRTHKQLAKSCRMSKGRIIYNRPDGGTAEFHALSSRPESAEGLNLTTCVLDETHAHKSDALLRAVEYSIISREEDGGGMVLSISTAGDDLTHFYYTGWYTRAKNILAGEDTDPTTYAEVYEATQDFDNPASWYAANPSLNLGAGITEAGFRADYLTAKTSPSSWANFLRYRLNCFTSAAENRFIDLCDWDKCRKVMSDDQLAPYSCVVGVDLSEVEDPTSIAITWALPNNQYHVKCFGIVCEEGVRKREKQNLPTYREYVKEGNFTIEPGNMLNAEQVEAFLNSLTKRYKVKKMVFDQTGAFVLMGRMAAFGQVCERHPQTHRFFDQPMKEFHKAIKEGRLTHDGTGWLRACIHNTRLDVTKDGAWRPDSRRSVDHIDGCVASVMSFGQCYTVTNSTAPEIPWRSCSVEWV